MTDNYLGPPGKVKPGATASTGPNTTNHVQDNAHRLGAAALRRRRRAADRSVPLMCGCRDPWTHKCQDREPSERQVDAYKAAIGTIRAAGLTPAAFLPELRMLWRRGGADQRLAVRVAERWELSA